MAASSNVCSCAELAASNQALRLRCAQLEEENARLRDQIAAAAAAAATSHSSAGAGWANGDAEAATAAAEEDGELTVEEILRSTAQEMAREAEAEAAAAPATAALSIVEDLKAAAEEALGSQGYVYDERTGLYLDTGSGYYYDPTEQLFYNSRTGVYYTYNSRTQEYVFHSRVPLSELKEQAELIAVMSGAQHRPPPKPAALGQKATGDGGSRSSSGSRRRTRDRHRRSHRHRRLTRRRSDSDSSRSRSRSQRSRSRSVGSAADGEDKATSRRKRRKVSKKRHKKARKAEEDERSNKKKKTRRKSADSGGAEAGTALRQPEEHYPPCIRMLVLESPSLPVGSLQVVTRDGATLGRDPAAMPTILLAGDSGVSKLHCRILYSDPERQFQAVDMASQTGTRIGDRPISDRREISRPAPLTHGCRLRVGGTEFLCHIHEHPGGATCSRCEPGLVAPAAPAAAAATVSSSAPLDRRARLRQLKAKHGLLAAAGAGTGAAAPAGYADRAEARRRLVGPDDARRLPGDLELTAASAAISGAEAAGVALHLRDADNPGVRLLAGMGWRPGEGIGRGSRAERSLREPLDAAPRLSERAGLGSELDRAAPQEAGDQRRARVAMATRERYNRLVAEQPAAAADSKSA